MGCWIISQIVRTAILAADVGFVEIVPNLVYVNVAYYKCALIYWFNEIFQNIKASLWFSEIINNMFAEWIILAFVFFFIYKIPVIFVISREVLKKKCMYPRKENEENLGNNRFP